MWKAVFSLSCRGVGRCVLLDFLLDAALRERTPSVARCGRSNCALFYFALPNIDRYEVLALSSEGQDYCLVSFEKKSYDRSIRIGYMSLLLL
eukprot:CCRYP_004765-RC/>CCRYP_004765-RC protein AED:0.47 eAED:1.00 QI:0/0/0/1/0/0/2/0/91